MTDRFLYDWRAGLLFLAGFLIFGNDCFWPISAYRHWLNRPFAALRRRQQWTSHSAGLPTRSSFIAVVRGRVNRATDPLSVTSSHY